MDGVSFAWVAEGEAGNYRVAWREMPREALVSGEVLVEVEYSSLNYKDALALTGRGKILRKFPLVCGIDLAGTVRESADANFRQGEAVLAVGQGLGETRGGGLAQFQCVPADALVRMPEGLDARRAMALGTAGFTAMLSLMALEKAGVCPANGEVLATGANGGVGSIAIALLAEHGFRVAASTGRAGRHGQLHALGAAEIVHRAELEVAGAPLLAERWAGGIDAVGGQTLANILAATKKHGAVAACGLAGGTNLPATVFPFILRGVSLLGINCTSASREQLVTGWRRLAQEMPAGKLDSLTRVEPLSAAMDLAKDLLAGTVHGRIVLEARG